MRLRTTRFRSSSENFAKASNSRSRRASSSCSLLTAPDPSHGRSERSLIVVSPRFAVWSDTGSVARNLNPSADSANLARWFAVRHNRGVSLAARGGSVLNRSIGLTAALAAVAVTAGCGLTGTQPSEPSQRSGKITVGDKTQDTQSIKCTQNEWGLTIDAKAAPGRAQAFLQLGGEKPVVQDSPNRKHWRHERRRGGRCRQRRGFRRQQRHLHDHRHRRGFRSRPTQVRQRTCPSRSKHPADPRPVASSACRRMLAPIAQHQYVSGLAAAMTVIAMGLGYAISIGDPTILSANLQVVSQRPANHGKHLHVRRQPGDPDHGGRGAQRRRARRPLRHAPHVPGRVVRRDRFQRAGRRRADSGGVDRRPRRCRA